MQERVSSKKRKQGHRKLCLLLFPDDNACVCWNQCGGESISAVKADSVIEQDDKIICSNILEADFDLCHYLACVFCGGVLDCKTYFAKFFGWRLLARGLFLSRAPSCEFFQKLGGCAYDGKKDYASKR